MNFSNIFFYLFIIFFCGGGGGGFIRDGRLSKKIANSFKKVETISNNIYTTLSKEKFTMKTTSYAEKRFADKIQMFTTKTLIEFAKDLFIRMQIVLHLRNCNNVSKNFRLQLFLKKWTLKNLEILI